MSDIVNKLVDLLKPTINDLDTKKEELAIKNKTLSEVNEMLDEVNDDVTKVSKYKNQELIVSNLDDIKSTEREYKSCCYLLDSVDEKIKTLPQYIEASNYIERLINYFKKLKEKLSLEVSELQVVCEEKELNKKYYEILSKDNPVVNDASEFRNLLDRQELSDSDKIDLLVFVLKNNVNSYLGKNS